MRLLLVLLSLTVSLISAPHYPFPQQRDFAGCIKPTHVTQEEMNQSVSTLFDFYKRTYVTAAKNTVGGYYTDASGNGGGGKNAVTVSEAHGYGMIIFALMAGYDSEAQTIFDGYFKFYQDHPSKINPVCMSWEVDSDESSKANDGASDGDMDIAYALILADKQWGSSGTINYLAEAKKIINEGIKKSDMHQENYRVALGDWNQPEEDNRTDTWATRSSDWMPDHMRAYKSVTGDAFWDTASTTVYDLIASLTQNYASQTGLVPDFATANPPKPDRKGGGTGEKQADKYSYNGCRFPWRIATDYAHNGTPEAKAELARLSSWLRSSTGDDPTKIRAGYNLDGSKLANYSELVFTAPFTAGLIANSDNQDFLNDCWDEIKDDMGLNDRKPDAYYTALNLLSMLLITGNWWSPLDGETPVEPSKPTDIKLSETEVFDTLSVDGLIGVLSTIDGEGPFTYSVVQGKDTVYISHDSLFLSQKISAENTPVLKFKIKVVDKNGALKKVLFSLEVKELATPILSYSKAVVHHLALLGNSTQSISLMIPQSGMYSVRIFSAQGRLLYQQRVSLGVGVQEVSLGYSLAKGMAIVQVQGLKTTLSETIVVQ